MSPWSFSSRKDSRKKSGFDHSFAFDQVKKIRKNQKSKSVKIKSLEFSKIKINQNLFFPENEKSKSITNMILILIRVIYHIKSKSYDPCREHCQDSPTQGSSEIVSNSSPSNQLNLLGDFYKPS